MNFKAEEILKKINNLPKDNYQIESRFQFPYTYIQIYSNAFLDRDYAEQEEILANDLKISIEDLRQFQARSLVVISFEEKALESNQAPLVTGHHWLSKAMGIEKKNLEEGKIRCLHFYGFKGGQARSTVLGMLANTLADDGWKVLIIDADIEAPSLHSMYGKKSSELSKSLLGAYLEKEILSISAYSSRQIHFPGFVDIIPCKPDLAGYDIEYSAFLIKAANDPHIIRELSNLLNIFTETKHYDLILFDHRSGLSSFPLFWYENFPGSVVFYARLDEQWRSGLNFIKLFSELAKEQTKVVVSFKPDEEQSISFRERNQIQIETLLQTISDISEEDEIDPINISQWIEWPYEKTFRNSNLPKLDLIHSDLRTAINNLRSELDLTKVIQDTTHLPFYSKSGANDEGDFIITSVARNILNSESNISYIFGRKGTGKTRLYRELFENKLGKPLLCSSDFNQGYGLISGNNDIYSGSEKFSKRKDMFWWTLILAGLKSDDYQSNSIAEHWKSLWDLTTEQIFDSLHEAITNLNQTITILIDGVEISFPGNDIPVYTDALFRVLNTIQNDTKINKKIKFKLFLRDDLRKWGTQNVEQQIDGRDIYLYWDTVSILNFLLLRISESSAFHKNFKEIIEKIKTKVPEIKSGNLLSEMEAENILKEIFPPRIKRYKITIMSFFKNYFSDASGTNDNGNRLNYYPRVFMDFIDIISHPEKSKIRYGGSGLENGIMDQELVFLAHSQATGNFFQQVKEELNNMIQFDNDLEQNKAKLEFFLGRMSGEATPFETKNLIDSLKTKTQMRKTDIQKAMDAMKSIGIFEDWPNNPGHWRVGKLFKQALNMKFKR